MDERSGPPLGPASAAVRNDSRRSLQGTPVEGTVCPRPGITARSASSRCFRQVSDGPTMLKLRRNAAVERLGEGPPILFVHGD